MAPRIYTTISLAGRSCQETRTPQHTKAPLVALRSVKPSAAAVIGRKTAHGEQINAGQTQRFQENVNPRCLGGRLKWQDINTGSPNSDGSTSNQADDMLWRCDWTIWGANVNPTCSVHQVPSCSSSKQSLVLVLRNCDKGWGQECVRKFQLHQKGRLSKAKSGQRGLFLAPGSSTAVC